MQFSSDQIDAMNETAVREAILAPLLSKLGYKFGTTNYIEYEEQLETITYQLGRKSRKDFPIGKPDYRCGVDGQRGSFIVEAKEGSHPINREDINQAHSYAAHGLVNAQFFVLSNGHEFQVYATALGVGAAPIAVVRNENLAGEFYRLSTLLSPENLMKHSEVHYDLSLPLSPNLPPRIKLKYGWATMPKIEFYFWGQPKGAFEAFINQAPLGHSMMATLESYKKNRQPIIDGNVYRDADGRIKADLEFDSIDAGNAHNLAKLGFKRMRFVTDDRYASTDLRKPNIFETISESNVMKGTELYSPLSGQMETQIGDIKSFINIKAAGALENRAFCGYYISFSKILYNFPNFRIPPLIGTIEGEFVIDME